MIEYIKHQIQLAILRADIKGYEKELEQIEEQRKNDDEAEEVISAGLALSRRKMQVLTHGKLELVR